MKAQFLEYTILCSHTKDGRIITMNLNFSKHLIRLEVKGTLEPPSQRLSALVLAYHNLLRYVLGLGLSSPRE